MIRQQPPLAKITRPRISGVLPRERLFRLLDEAGKCPVTWISAPAGSGKTTLAAGYLMEKGRPCLWYQVDEGDADLATFFNYMRLAAQKAAPRKRRPLPFLTPEYLSNLPVFALRYFEDLFSRLNTGALMVLDNYQTVPPESRFHELMARMGGAVPEGIRVLVISRRDPPAAWAGFMGRGLLKVLGWDNLRLTLEEAAGIVPLKTRENISGDRIEQLHRAADGWVAGLVLMLENAKQGGALPSQGILAPREILDYFGNEFFNQTDPQVQDFLLRTAWLPKISVPAARQLSGLPQADRLLAELNRSNTFTERQVTGEPVYQYHPLFREFLLTRARETFSSESLSNLRRQAAALLEREGQIEAAVTLFQDLDDWEALRRLIMTQAASLNEQGRIGPLEAWLKSLPKNVLENDPWLLYWLGICRLQVAPLQSTPFFEKAFALFQVRKDVAGTCLALWGVVHAHMYAMADFRPLDRWIGILEDLGKRGLTFPSDEIELRFASAIYTALVYRQPQHPEIETWEEKVWELAEKSSNQSLRIQTLATIAFYKSTIGDFIRALTAIDTLKKWSPEKETTPLIRIRLRAIEAAFYKYQGSHAECMQAVFEGLNLSRTFGIGVFAPMLCYHGATSALGMNDYPLARNLIDQVAQAQEKLRPYDRVIFHSLKVQEALFIGDKDTAFYHIEKATKLKTDAGFDLINGWCFIQNSYVLQMLGRQSEAEDFLAQSIRFAEIINGKNNTYAAFLTKAHFAFDRGNDQEGLMAIGKAFALGRENGNYSTWGPPRPSDVGRLCLKALEAGIETDYTREFIRRFHLGPPEGTIPPENWPWPLKIYTLGRFALVKEGKPIQFSRKIQKKPLLLLKALVALGGKNVSEERLTDILWPESDGDRAYSALTTNIFRLRQLVGENMLEVQNGAVNLNAQECWVDAWTFETLYGRSVGSLGASGPRDGRSDAGRWLEKALELYRGPFLNEEGGDFYWTLPYREKLSERFIQLIMLLGRSLETQGLWDQAVSIYRKGLEADNLAEELYRRLMFCYAKKGDTVQAIRVYRSLKTTLSTVLGVEPSPGTETLYRSFTT